MSKEDNNTEKQNDNNKKDIKDIIIKIILIIIIIILLLHNCALVRKYGKEKQEKLNIIDINNKCKTLDEQSIDCLKDKNNDKCMVPNFIGKSKKDVLKWLSRVSNTIEIEIKTVENPDYKDGTVIDQSIYDVSVNELLSRKTKIVITIVNNGSLVDCKKNSQSAKCSLPDFKGKSRDNVEDWLDAISNNVKVKFIYIESDEKPGTIIKQTIKSGTAIKDILDKDETIIIYISSGKPKNPYTNNSDDDQENSSSTTPDEPAEEEPDGDFYVSDNEIARWQNETNLNIFEDSDSISKVRGKIAPESTGTYKFIVNNGTKYNLKYKIKFSDNNQYNINMKYKLKKGDTYLIDHYVSYNDLNLENLLLNSKSSDSYYLEWKWIGDNDNNDTQIGKNANSSNIKYSLKIDIEAESI